jgi:hypothetical protein
MAITIPILILLKAAVALTVLHGGSPGPDPDPEPEVLEIPACHHSGVCDPLYMVIKDACSYEAPEFPGPSCDPSDWMDDLPSPPEPDPGALAPMADGGGVSEIPACHHSGVCDPLYMVIKDACSYEAPEFPGPSCDPSDWMDDLPSPPEPDRNSLSATPEPEPGDGADHPADDDRDRPVPDEEQGEDDEARRPGDPEHEVPGAEDDDREGGPSSDPEPQPSTGAGAQR